MKNISIQYRAEKRLAIDGGVFYCAYDFINHKWSPMLFHPNCRVRKICAFYINRAVEQGFSK